MKSTFGGALRRFLGSLRGRAGSGSALTREHVVWGYRLLLGREPESERVIADWLRTGWSFDTFRGEVISSAEFRTKNPSVFSYAFQRSVVIKELDEGPRLFVDL